jgi:hypothetical protein
LKVESYFTAILNSLFSTLNYFIRILLTIKIKRYYGCKYG